MNYGTKDNMQTSFLESCLQVIQIEVNYTEIIVARLDVRGEIFSILSSFIPQSVLYDNFWGKKIIFRFINYGKQRGVLKTGSEIKWSKKTCEQRRTK